MKTLRRAACLLLSVLLVGGLLTGLAVPDIILTAVNDQFLPLSSSTMPTRKNGEIYVPYSVFTGTLGLQGAYSSAQQLLVLYNWDHTLNFSVGQGYVYDENDTSYTQPAYTINGTTYVPAKLVCGIFGFSYSTISSSYPVVRIANDSAKLSDRAFGAGATETVNRMVKNYLNPSTSTGGENTDTPTKTEPQIPVQPPKAEEAIPHPSVVYLTFSGTPGEKTDEILNILSTYRRTATFFLTTDSVLAHDSAVRRMVAGGHALGLSITADASVADPTALVARLDQANDNLLLVCGVQTRLVFVENGTDNLSQAQRNALVGAGYRLWDATLTAGEGSRSAYRGAETVLKGFQRSTAPAVVALGQSKNTPETLTYILRYMRETAISHATIQLSTTPLNDSGDTR